MINHNTQYCSLCDAMEEGVRENVCDMTHAACKEEQHDEVSFAVLLALVPAMTMTLFNMMGLM